MTYKKNGIAPCKGSECDASLTTRCLNSLPSRMAIIGCALLALSGCAALNIGDSEYGCPGMPEGVQCKSARQVYEMTNGGQVPNPMIVDDKKGESATGDRDYAQGTLIPNHGEEDAVVSKYVAPNLPDRPIPIRTPAEVMRIWVAPWEDTNGDLNVAGYVYTEIEPRRWVIGKRSEDRNTVLTPLKVDRHK